MAEKISDVYDDDTTAGDDKTTEGYTPFDARSGTATARSDTQLADVIATRLGIPLSSTPGDTTAPVIAEFIGTVTIDSLVVGIEIQATDNVGITGWIIKEDDTSLPDPLDSDWENSVYTEFTISDYNQHNLTLRTRDDALNVSTPFTITVTPIQTSTSVPTVDTFTTTNPAANSQDYTFTMTATPSSGETISHYKLTENDVVQPLAGDPGWVPDTDPWNAVAASLTNFEDTDVRIYVKDTGDLVSTGVLSRVSVSSGGDTDPTTGDFLWQNDPTITAYAGPWSWTVTDGQSITVDGSTMSGAADVDGQAGGGAPAADHLFKFVGNHAHTTGATINITNMRLRDAGLSAIYLQDLVNATVKIWNNDISETNINGIATNFYKGALSATNCDGAQIYFDGNKLDDVDGGVWVDTARDSATAQKSNLYMRNNWLGNLKWHSGPLNISYLAVAFSSVGGEVSQNINYAPGNTTAGEDLFNLNGCSGTALAPVILTRNRTWGRNPSAFSNAIFQIGDGNEDCQFVQVYENTMIDSNTPGQISSGNNNKFSNNKAYTSEQSPSIGFGLPYQHQRQQSDAGTMYGNEVTGNTIMHWWDPRDGGVIQQRPPWFPDYGFDASSVQGGPNEGLCIGTCGTEDSVSPVGWSSNEWFEPSFANGNGKIILWRSSWNEYRYAGEDGINPSIDYSSPWIGDGGGQNFTAANVSGDAAYGDQSIEGGSTQVHDWQNLINGGVTPYTLVSVSTSTPSIITVTSISQVLSFTPDAEGSFTYQYTVEDSTGASVTGTISGTVLASSSTQDYFDQDSLNYIAIDPSNYDEYFPRASHEWDFVSAGPYGTPYGQSKPYTTNVAVGDVETSSPELVYRVHFDQSGTYDIFIMGMALNSNSYDECWVGWDDSPDSTRIKIETDDAVFRWADSEQAQLVVDVGVKSEYDLHVWMKEGGFALGAIEVHIQGAGTPKVADSTTSPHTESPRVAY